MADQVTNISGKKGTTAGDRRISAAVSAPTNAPSGSSAGYLTNRSRFMHLLFDAKGTNPAFLVQIWWWSDISDIWHKGEVVTVNGPDIITLETQGLLRVAIQVVQVAGTNPTMDAWLALVKET